jgi:hypothetical protein
MTTTPAIPRYLADPQGYHRDQYHKRRQAIYDLLGGKCVRCGTTDSLQVDHIDRAQKTMEISDNMSLKRADVLAELAKCQLLCQTCHAAKTGNEMTGFTHGTQYGWKNMKCACTLCSVRKERDQTAAAAKKRGARASRPMVRGPYRKQQP